MGALDTMARASFGLFGTDEELLKMPGMARAGIQTVKEKQLLAIVLHRSPLKFR